MKTCTEPDCQAPVVARGLCRSHYNHKRYSGEIDVLPRPSPEERFSLYVGDPTPSGCLPWVGAKDRRGYGQFWADGKPRRAYRWAYERAFGAPPEGTHLDHLCDYTSCVNVDHLKVVTPRENILRGNGPCAVHARQTHCKRGHEFTTDNTLLRRDGGRSCRECARLRRRAKRNGMAFE